MGTPLLFLSPRYWQQLPLIAWAYQRPMVWKTLEIGFRLLLATIWLSSGWAKFDDFDTFQRSVYDYQLLPVPVATIFSFMVPPIELLLGGYLLAGAWVRWAALGSAGLLVVFMLAIGWAMAHGLDINCGCLIGGNNQPVGWPKLAENTGLVLVSLWLWASPKGWLRVENTL